MTSAERYQTLLKLHRQFAHPSEKKLISLLKNAGSWQDNFLEDIKLIHQRCKICKVYARTPPRPVVGLPLAHRFNEKVAMDLKSWNPRWILYMIDMWSRLTISVNVKKHILIR